MVLPVSDTSQHIHAMDAAGSMTAEELLHLNLPNTRTELVRGRLIVREPAGYRHGDVAARLLVIVGSFVHEHQVGRVFAAETGFTLERNPDTVRAPDVAFIRTERLLHTPPRGFAEIAPDLAAEVLSPDDRPGEVLAKVADWLKAGTRLVWVVDPVRKHARVYRADGTEALVAMGESLEGEDVVPGFSCLFDDVLS